MDISQIVYQLRKYCPLLKSVAAAGDLTIINEQTNLPLPAAFVVPISIETEKNESLNSTFQIVLNTFAVVVCLDNTTDARGQLTATIDVNAMWYALYKALVGWYIETEPSMRAVYAIDKSEQLTFDRSRNWWQFLYAYETVLDQTWAFVPPSTPITGIDTTFAVNTVGNATNFDFDVVTQQ